MGEFWRRYCYWLRILWQVGEMAQRWYQKASVQTAIVTGFVLVIVTTIPLALQVPKLKDKNEELQRKLQKGTPRYKQKTLKFNALRPSLVPFKTIALERFTGDETEALGKLADRIKTLEDQIGEVARLKAIGGSRSRRTKNNDPYCSRSRVRRKTKIFVHDMRGRNSLINSTVTVEFFP